MARYYSRAHFARVSGYPDPPAEVKKLRAERVARAEAGRRANAEMMARFDPLTPECMLEALQWQDRRIAELLEEA